MKLMAEEQSGSRKKRGLWGIVLGLLVLHLALSYWGSRRNAIVVDEPYHLARGAGLVFFHDFTFAVSHPPLGNLLNALPLLTLSELRLPDKTLVFKSRTMDPSDRRNAFAHLLVQELNPDTKKIINRARIATVVLSVSFGFFIFLWSRQIFGEKAGLLALFLYCLDPNLLAHASLATNDLSASFFICLSLYFFWRLFQKPKLVNLGLALLFLGLAQLCKFSAFLLYPLYFLLWLITFRQRKKQNPELSWTNIRRPGFYFSFWSLLLVFLGSLFVIWAGYGFQGNLRWNFSPLLQGEICQLGTFRSHLKCGLVELLARIPLPPRTFYYGFARTLLLTEQHENPLYFLGKVSQQGWWYYYPILFLIKTPIPVLILMALAVLFRKQLNTNFPLTRFFLLLPIIWFFLGFFVFNRKEIGIRHLLMIYPLLFLLVSGLIDFLTRSVQRKVWFGILLVWLALSSLLSFPDYLTYFNEAVARRKGGLKISVLGEDWGQGLSALADFQKKHQLEPLFYQPYGILNPKSYGLVSQEMNCNPPQPGYYAIHLAQLVRPLRSENLNQCVEFFKSKEPLYKIKGTIWVWKISP